MKFSCYDSSLMGVPKMSGMMGTESLYIMYQLMGDDLLGNNIWDGLVGEHP